MALPVASEGLTYLCIGPFCWGKAKDAVKAASNARSEGGPGKYVLHLVNEEARVDDVSGGFHYSKSTPGIRLNIVEFNLRAMLA